MVGISAGYDDFEDAYEIGIKHNLSASARAVLLRIYFLDRGNGCCEPLKKMALSVGSRCQPCDEPFVRLRDAA